jgi:hypothetical protein
LKSSDLPKGGQWKQNQDDVGIVFRVASFHWNARSKPG